MASTTSPNESLNLAIVGGGITGLTLAISLLKHNINVTIYESAASFGEIGAGVGFGPNAVRGMGLISPEMEAAYERCRTRQWESKEHIWFTVRLGDHKKVGDNGLVKREDYEKLKNGAPMFEVYYTGDGPRGGVHRAHFLNQLVKLIPESVPRFCKRLLDVTQPDGSEDVVLHFADGTSAQHTAVLGCDGIKSRTRELLLGKEKRAVFTGKYVYRGLIPMAKAVEMLGEEQAMNSQMYLGYHGHMITFPIEKGKTLNVVAFNSCETWTDSRWVVPTTKEEMVANYRTWGPSCSAIVAAMEKPDVWALFNHPPAPTYHGSQPLICLVGDAAHASTPHQGAGAGICIEDCYILGNLIAEARSVGGLHRAFRAYEEIRRPRTLKLVETSRQAGLLYDFESQGDDLEAVERDMKSRMSWIWDINLVAELEKAKAIFRPLN
ncbi:Uu.00g095970.m01.CDS01 [Anthostomella pinea]|uniref:Uu.00g095970.m01.CDS01 n=1 Tax=Anthostomella pinea TaxID=933095 RepID=A0AAI8YF13_9PEZI|nr:Uu.00g095970.m01.CDS01 [Anthostomella pinea]